MIPFLRSPLLIFFILLSSSLSLFSQETVIQKDSIITEKLEEVVITANRTLRQLSAVPLPVQIVSKKEIGIINSIRLSDILEEQTGLITVPDFGGGEGIQLQGLDSQYVLILIDGVPLVGRSAGTFDLNRLSVGNIKQIEIVKGASSSLYGNEALGGVINIITEKPKNGFSGDVNYRTGSFNAHDSGLNINYKKEKFGITTFFNRNSNDGYDLDKTTLVNTVDPFTSYTTSTNINYNISDKTKLLLSGRYYNQFQNELVISENFTSENSINEWNINFRAEHEFNSKWKSYLELYGSQYLVEDVTISEISQDAQKNDFNQRFLRPELRTTYKPNSESEFIAGIGLTNERLERNLFSTVPEFNAPYIYGQYDGEIIEDLNVILGARFDWHNEYASQFSPKAALKLKLNEKVTISTSVGYGFKAPDFRQLYLDFTNAAGGNYTVIGYNEVPRRLQELFELGLLNIDESQYPTQEDQQGFVNEIASQFNDNLKPESAVNVNLGFDYKHSNNLKFNVNAFRNNITNLIDFFAIAQRDNGQNVFSYQNRAEVYTQGIELDVRCKLLDNITVSGGYQLLYAYDKEAQRDFENGRVFARDAETLASFRLSEDDYFGLFNRSRHIANAKVFYEIPKWNMSTNLRATYRSKFGITDTNNNGYLDQFDDFVDAQTIVDVALNKTFYKNYTLGLGVDNVFDLTDTQSPNIPGRILYATMNINF